MSDWWFAAKPGVLAVVLMTVMGAACSDSPTTPTSTTPTLSFVTEAPFVGTLALSGTSSKDFVMNQAGPVSITLASLLAAGSPVSITVRIGLGTWDAGASTCTVTEQVDVAPALTIIPNFGQSLTAGSRCVSIFDFNGLGPVDFAIRIVHPS
ncbi:MAG: hypothetical protein WBD07_12115 [Vicinamibacterales bacterium]